MKRQHLVDDFISTIYKSKSTTKSTIGNKHISVQSHNNISEQKQPNERDQDKLPVTLQDYERDINNDTINNTLMERLNMEAKYIVNKKPMNMSLPYSNNDNEILTGCAYIGKLEDISDFSTKKILLKKGL